MSVKVILETDQTKVWAGAVRVMGKFRGWRVPAGQGSNTNPKQLNPQLHDVWCRTPAVANVRVLALLLGQ